MRGYDQFDVASPRYPVRRWRLAGTTTVMTKGAHRPAIVVAAMLAFGTAACGGSGLASRPSPSQVQPGGQWSTRTLDRNQISLSVPSGWYVGRAWDSPGSFSYLVGSFSNQPLLPPCITTLHSMTCGPPLAALRPGGVLVDVYQNAGIPPWTLDRQPGAPTMVSGLPARVAVDSGPTATCGGLGADLTRTEAIALPAAPDNYFEVNVCSRGVDGAVGARILASVRVKPIG